MLKMVPVRVRRCYHGGYELLVAINGGGTCQSPQRPLRSHNPHNPSAPGDAGSCRPRRPQSWMIDIHVLGYNQHHSVGNTMPDLPVLLNCTPLQGRAAESMQKLGQRKLGHRGPSARSLPLSSLETVRRLHVDISCSILGVIGSKNS
jgi:hypothetical protein